MIDKLEFIILERQVIKEILTLLSNCHIYE